MFVTCALRFTVSLVAAYMAISNLTDNHYLQLPPKIACVGGPWSKSRRENRHRPLVSTLYLLTLSMCVVDFAVSVYYLITHRIVMKTSHAYCLRRTRGGCMAGSCFEANRNDCGHKNIVLYCTFLITALLLFVYHR